MRLRTPITTAVIVVSLSMAGVGCTAESDGTSGTAPSAAAPSAPSSPGPVLDTVSCEDWATALSPVNADRIEYVTRDGVDPWTGQLSKCRVEPPEEPDAVPADAEFALIWIDVRHGDPSGIGLPTVVLPIESNEWSDLLTNHYVEPLGGEYRCWGHGQDCDDETVGAAEERVFRFIYEGCYKYTCLEVDIKFATDHDDDSWQDEALAQAEKNLAGAVAYAVTTYYPGDL